MVAPDFAVHGHALHSLLLPRFSPLLLALGHLALSAIIFSSVVFSAAVSSPFSDPSRQGSVNGRDLSHLGDGKHLNPFLQLGSQGRLTQGGRTFSQTVLVAWLGREG